MVKNKRDARFYQFLTLNDNTKIIHSEVLEKNGGEQVEVRIKKAVNGKIRSASCWLPDYRWENIVGFSEVEIKYFQGYLETIAPKGFRNISLRTLTANRATHIGNPPEITLTF